MFSKRFQTNKFSLLKTTLLLLCTIYATGSHAQINLTFGVYAADRPTMMVRAYRPVLTALEKVLSERLQQEVSIRMQVASSYQKGIDALAKGRVDFAMLGPASYIEAVNLQPSLKILALESKDGSKTFNGIICVREDSEIEHISDLEGKRFAFGNERSTIGRYLSQALLTRNGITAHNLESFDYLDRHDRVAQSVAKNEYDAGALKEGTYKKLKMKGYKLRTLTTIALVNRPWVASAELDQNLLATLKESMLTLDAPEAFMALGRNQFVQGNDSDFIDIRSAINDNTAFFTKKKEQIADVVR